MGAVYLSHTPGARPVAMKVARPELAADPGFRERFAKEVEIAARVQGLYTAPVVDSDARAPRPWLATAYIPAPSLAAVVAQQGPRRWIEVQSPVPPTSDAFFVPDDWRALPEER